MKTLPIIGIYKITSPTGKVYIGQSRNIKKRFTSYKCLSKKNKGQPKLYNSLLKYRAINHVFEVIEECDFEQMNIRERYWQDHYDVLSCNGLNCKLTETNILPSVITKETRLKHSITAKKRMSNLINNPEYMAKMKANGLKRRGVSLPNKTPEQIENSRQASLKNKSFKGENNPWFNKPRFGHANPNFGKITSEAIKIKISLANKGNTHTIENRNIMSIKRSMGGNVKAKIVLNLETGIYYECGKEAWLTISHYAWTTLRCKMNGSLKNNTSFVYA